MNKEALNDLKSMITASPQLPNDERAEMLEKVEKAGTPLQTDKMIYRMVVGGLVFAILACLTFTFLISLENTNPDTSIDIPEIFMAIGSAAVGALAGLLAPSPGRGGDVL